MSNGDDRFSAIAHGGLKRRPLSPKPVTDSAPAAEPTQANETAETGALDVLPGPTRRRTGERPTGPSAETGGTRRVAFRVPEALDAKLRARARSDDTSKVNVVLDAIEHVVTEKIELSFESRGANGARSSLFVRPRTPTAASPSIQTDIVLDVQSLTTVDKLAKDYKAPTRTAFLLACLEQYL
jgi:hypothetical protein